MDRPDFVHAAKINFQQSDVSQKHLAFKLDS